MNEPSTICQRIRDERKRLGLSQAKLAEMVGASQQAVNRIENGETSRSQYLAAILDALGIDSNKNHVLGLRIRLGRKAAGLSQIDVATQMGVSPQAVSQWESGVSAPSASNLIKLSNLIGMDLNMRPELPVADVNLSSRIRRAREAERLRMIAKDMRSRAEELDDMANHMERG